MRILSALALLAFATACSHPLHIQGEGDIVSSTGTNDCTLEEQPCANNVAGDYNVTYTAVPRDGWDFLKWINCGKTGFPDCSFNIPAETVDQFWFETAPSLTAVFVQGLAPGVPGVRVGSVRGNTVNFGSAAEFTVSLNTQPTDDVTFFVTSTDESEGLPEVGEFTFTAANWSQQQTVVVRGQNGAPDDHLQDYHITFGPSMSVDVAYDGLLTPAVAMKGLSVDLMRPPQPLNLLSSIEVQQGLDYEYTGYDALTFALTASPAGMTIDPGNGVLTWTPQESDEGQTFPVTVTVTDGVVNGEVAFEIGVFQPEPLVVANTESSVVVNDPDSSLDGLNISSTETLPQTNFSQLGLDTIGIGGAPAIPSQITPISDVFVLPEHLDESIEIRFPIGSIPAEISLDDINVYVYTGDLGPYQSNWAPVFLDYYYEGVVDSPVYVAKLEGLIGMAFIGYNQVFPADPIPVSASTAVQSRSVSTSSADVTCIPNPSWFPGGELNYNKQKCTSTLDDEFEIIVKNFGEGTRWGGTTIEELAAWLVEARGRATEHKGMIDLGMSPNPKFTVNVRWMLLGQGSVDPFACGTLHLSDDSSIPKSGMKGTIVHEYFHHGQCRTEEKWREIENIGFAKWLLEGSADWFEDYVFDVDNSYRYPSGDIITWNKNGNSLPPIMEKGVNAYSAGLKVPGVTPSGRWPYYRYPFFKLLASKCNPESTDLFANILNVDKVTDWSGIRNLSSQLSSAGCDFGDHLGVAKQSSLEAALVYYQFATLYEDDMRLLDHNELNGLGDFGKERHVFTRGSSRWSDIADLLSAGSMSPYTLTGVDSIPAAGAVSFTVYELVDPLPSGYRAELRVEAGAEVIVSILSEDSDFQNTNTADDLAGYSGATIPHYSFPTANGLAFYRYGVDDEVPQLFVTIVNPSLEDAVDVEVSFNIVEMAQPQLLALNDTGITFGGNYPSGNNADCSGVNIAQQDCSHGRDFTHNDDSDGHAGFSYTKVASDGTALPGNASDWACVRDNVTGLVWEMKTDDGSIHDKDNTYRWGGKTAQGTGLGTYYPEWDTLVDGSNNEALCGFSDGWRVPTLAELQGLVNYNVHTPAIDTTWFPNTWSETFWSASPTASAQNTAWIVHFNVGETAQNFRNYDFFVRLVRVGQ